MGIDEYRKRKATHVGNRVSYDGWRGSKASKNSLEFEHLVREDRRVQNLDIRTTLDTTVAVQIFDLNVILQQLGATDLQLLIRVRFCGRVL